MVRLVSQSEVSSKFRILERIAVYTELYYLSTTISLKSSFFPSCLYSWIAFFIARSPMSEANLRRGEISSPIFSCINDSFSPRISSRFHHSSISPVIDTQAVATIDIYPSNENCFRRLSSITRKTSTTSAQTRLCSL